MNEFTRTLRGMSVLIVDDNPTNIVVLRKTLETQGLIISMAYCGEEALKMTAHSAPDLILLDIIMPGIDGYETCRRLKRDKATQAIPVLFITAMAKIEDIVKGFAVGGADYITKPFCLEEVISRVQTHLTLEKLIKEKKQQTQLIKRLDTLARHDPLTDLSNRRDAMEKIEREQLRFKRFDKPYSLIMMDIDNFKKINDKHGHNAGDCVLQKTAKLLRSNTREIDILSRWGGEEFLIVLPETRLEGAVFMAEKIREGLATLTISYNEITLNITASFGVNCHADSEMSIEDMMIIADRRLYLAKEMGRNKVVSAE